MSNNKREKDEHLERLWYMKEKEQESMTAFETAMEGDFDSAIVEELLWEELIEVKETKADIKLTSKGEERARKIVRAHRLGERLLYDVFGGEFETGACELEHIVTEEIVDGICVLLGHPRECPHGMPIPEGECCRQSARTIHNLIIPLTELVVGSSARIAYINYSDEHQMHKVDGLQIRPGATVKLRQRYPCYVIECEGTTVAMDVEIASNVRVWSKERQFKPAETLSPEEKPRESGGWARLLRFAKGK